MKLCRLNENEFDKLMRIIESCKGPIYLKCDNMSINLKSKLTQYFAIAKLFSNGDDISEMELFAPDPEDNTKLINFLLRGIYEF